MNMKVKDFSCELNTPDAYQDKGSSFSLPPYARRNAHKVDEYPLSPASWMRGGADATSYFVPVEEGKGMWLDFNGNFNLKHHVAILLSIQGINPLTGLKSTTGLEQYRKCCPKHGTAFQSDRFCPDCGFKWPAQNYMATTGTPHGYLWLDGFRSDDGNIRQYVFTKDEARGVAAQLIGNERVFAIAVSYYLSKKEKPTPPAMDIRPGLSDSDFVHPWKKYSNTGPIWISQPNDVIYEDGGKLDLDYGTYCSSASDLSERRIVNRSMLRSSDGLKGKIMAQAANFAAEPELEPEKLEIAAGARITQQIYDDPEDLSFWREKPDGTLYICYCTEADAKRILGAGKRAEKQEGFLSEIKVGN